VHSETVYCQTRNDVPTVTTAQTRQNPKNGRVNSTKELQRWDGGVDDKVTVKERGEVY